MSTRLPTIYQDFIHISRYARYSDDLKRRETWNETVGRYIDFFKKKTDNNKKVPWEELRQAILNLEVMPSMRALMTAGPALEKDQVSGFNCSYIVIDNPKSFDEMMYILMCFDPDTKVKTKRGPVAISQLRIGDVVMSFDEATSDYVWKPVTQVIETPSAHLPKLAITLESGEVVRCTDNHKWLTTNRGWVEAKDLTLDDDLMAPKYQIYKITNSKNGKPYIGFTSRSSEQRLHEHLKESKITSYTSHFKRAINKHGSDVWSVETIDCAHNLVEAKAKEKQWIKNLNTIDAGYNSTEGGDGATGYRWTKEQRTNASDNAYERTAAQRDEQRQVLKHAQTKIHATRKTPEYREAQRKRNLGSNNPMFGHQYTEQERQAKKEQAMIMKRDVSTGRFV